MRTPARHIGLSLRAFLFLFVFSPASVAFDLEGRVRAAPPFSESRTLEIPEEHAASCGTNKISPTLKISPEGFVANAVVKLEGNFPARTISNQEKAYELNQVRCEFAPHVLLLPQGETVSILNSESILHNVRAFNEKLEMLFNDAMPKRGQVLKKRFKEPGRVVIRCGIHPWMHALVIVQGHSYYALTDEAGSFQIRNIPDEIYTLTVWHETLGEIQKGVGPESSFLELTYKK